MNWRIIGIGLVILAVVIFGFSLADPLSGTDVSASTQLDIPKDDITGYERAIDTWDWQFPEDHGAHPEFQTEWWYYTGNVATDEGRRFGFQFTIFRRAITSENAMSDSEWRTDQVYMAHFTISDIENETFYHNERFSRGGAGLAGAENDPNLRVWLEDWQIISENDDFTLQRIIANAEDFGLDVQLEQAKPLVLQGEEGLSQKGDEAGMASQYYSLSRLITDGTITIGDETFNVSGTTWMDREFMTESYPKDAVGWDWFGLIFDNDMELVVGQLRLEGENKRKYGAGLIYPDGELRVLEFEEFTITPTSTWTSPHTGAEYPSGWTIEILTDDGFTFDVTPLQKDQELYTGGVKYWEGAVQISGDVTGYGYAELTGYAGSIAGRF